MTHSEHMFRYDSVPKSRLLIALKHNTRELQAIHGATTNIDPAKSHLNYCLHGKLKAEERYNDTFSKIALAGIHNYRINAVLAIECIFSLPITWHSRSELPSFFTDCYTWIKAQFEGELLCFDIHLDEAAPHAHAIILPILDGKLQGDKIKGSRAKIYERQQLFYKDVSAKYGFRDPTQKKLNKTNKHELASKVQQTLKDDPVMESRIYACVRDAIFNNPLPFAQMLGITIDQAKVNQRTFVDIKRSRGQGAFVR